MFVHLGGDLVVDAREVVAILDARRLRTAEARALVVAAGRQGPEPRAVVVTTRGSHAAPITAATVARRIARLAKTPTSKMAER